MKIMHFLFLTNEGGSVAGQWPSLRHCYSQHITQQRNCVVETCHMVLYFRTVHVVIFILFKPTHALFLKHIHIHI